MHLRWITENRIFRKIQHHPKQSRKLEPGSVKYVTSLIEDINDSLRSRLYYWKSVKIQYIDRTKTFHVHFNTHSQEQMFLKEFMDYLVRDYVVKKFEYDTTWIHDDKYKGVKTND